MRRTIAAALLLALAACNGAGRGNPMSGFVPGAQRAIAPDPQRRKHVGAYAHIVIPRRTAHRHRGGRPDFVSPSTRGIKIVATWQGGKSSSVVETTVDALGPHAPGCTSSSSSLSCTVQATVWEGPNKIDVTTYDKPPSGNRFPSNANELGFSSVTLRVVPGVTPSLAIFLGGEIGSIDAKPAFSSVPADGTPHDVAIAFNPKDFDGNKISAGTRDPFANPIRVTLDETGGNGHAVLLLNGSAGGSNATLKYSNDTLGVRYDGGGKSGYTIQVQLAAKGAPAQSLQISPLIVDGPGVASHALGLNGAAVSNALTITEKSAPSSQTYGVARSGCGGIAAIARFSGSGATASFTATGGTTASAGGCTIAITDGLSTTLSLPVTNRPIAGGVTIDGVRITEFAVGASPGPLAVGPDNTLYVVGNYNGGGNEIIPFKPASGSPTMGTAIPIPSSNLFDVAAASDGALWVVDMFLDGLDRVTTGGYVTKFQSPNYVMDCAPEGLTPANDGSLWTAGCGPLLNVTMGGGYVVPSISPSPPSNPTEMVQGADGAIYVADGTNVDRFDPNTNTLTQIAEPNGATVQALASAPNDGANGAIWYTADSFATTTIGYVGRLDVGAQTISIRAQLGSIGTSDQVNAIAAAADGAVWFTDPTSNDVDRLSMKNGSAVEKFPLPTANAGPYWIVVGPDGSLWLSENRAGNIARVIP